MTARTGAPPRRQAVLPGYCPPGGVTLRSPHRTACRRAAVGLLTAVLVAGVALSGCEYTYDDGWRPALQDVPPGPASRVPDAVDPWPNDPLSEEDMGAWLDGLQLGTGLQVAHRGYGLLRPHEVRTETAPGLRAGTYVLALACRSQEKVTFMVSNEENIMEDLLLLCGSRRQTVLHLSRETALTFRVQADAAANYAYRLMWL